MLTSQPCIAWVTGGVRERLHKVAYEKGVCSEQLAGDLIVAALLALEPSPSDSRQTGLRLNMATLRETLSDDDAAPARRTKTGRKG